jgi:hypothetical protein
MYEFGDPSRYGIMGPTYQLKRSLVAHVHCDIDWDEQKNRIY